MAVSGWQDQSVARPGGGSGTANVHAAWRLARAERAARAYASNQKLAALTVAGSVGTGLADRFSDLELDCYWFDPPMRMAALHRSRPLLGTSGNAQALREAETLLADTAQLVQARTDADISSFCEELSQHRRAVDPPAAEHRSAPP